MAVHAALGVIRAFQSAPGYDDRIDFLHSRKTPMRSHFPVVALLSVGTALLSSPDARAQETHPVRVTVVDADTAAPLPCRAYLRSEQGEWYFAKSADAAGTAVKYDVARSPTSLERHTTVSAHPFMFDAPPGKYSLTVERGKEYVSYEAPFTVADKSVEHTVKLQRWTNMAERGWYSGDTHVHRTLEDLPNVMLAEDLNVALPLSYWVRDAYTPPAQAERPASARDGDKSVGVKAELTQVDPTHVFWPVNTEYELFTVNGQRHTLGAVFVLNHKEPLRPAAPPVGPVAAEARAQGAILDLDKHSWPWSMMLIPVMNVDLFELSNNHVWRTEFFFKQWTIDQLPEEWNIEHDADGFTGWGWLDFGFKTYYALLNCGFRMRPTGGTASGVHPVPLGFGRVYVELPDGFSYDKWIAGLNAGRSFVTTGPMLFATVGDQPPGATIKAEGPTSVRVQGTVDSAQPISRIEIVKNGQVLEVIAPAIDRFNERTWRSTFDKQVQIDGTSWVAVRVFAGEPTDAGMRYAHSAPVFIDVADRPLPPRQYETAFLIRRMEIEIERNRAVLRPDELAEYERALDVYRGIAEQAR